MKARRLGAILKTTREHFGLDLAQVAADIDVNASTVSRIERGLHQSDHETMQALFNRYHLTFDQQRELLDLAAEAFRSGWWLEYGDVLHDVFAVMEDEAHRILSFQSQVVPGLLQTDAYARALFADGLAAPDPWETDDLERRVRARRERRAILDRMNPPQLHAVLGETAIRQQVGGADVMRVQLRRLVEIGGRENVTLQVLPYKAGAHAGMGGPFIIFEFEHPDDPDVVHTENLSGSAYSESRSAVERFRLAWGNVTDAALPPGESADMIAALAV
jgi:transcriptional regulator with XRE-family HTH domain